jgi:gliding motility-associated-like protein
MKGSNAAGALPVLGTQGVPDPANTPGPMFLPVGFKDLQSRFWVYGGSLFGGSQPFQMWMFDPSTNNWTWMSGTTQLNAPPVYGTQGVSSPSNYPGPRMGSCGWTDLTGNFWLFGNAYGTSKLNDLWKYDISTNQWTWMKGSSFTGNPGNYGTQGVPAMSNCPPARGHCSSWTDLNGDLWLFGGFGGGGNNVSYDDVWRYSISTNMWTWMRGSAGPNNTPPNHGVLGVPAQSNTPGGRWTDSHWRDSNGNFWLFSGMTGSFSTSYADVWKLNPATLLWTWMGGANTTNFTDSFTVKCSLNGGSPASADLNTVCWIDECDRLWQFGGEGRNPSSVGYTNSTWFFDPASGKFKWQGGDLAYFQLGVYGTQGVSSPSNYPPSAMGGVGFNDNQGNFWMFGGCITPLFPGSAVETNTMWKFRPDSICASLPSIVPIQASITASAPSACTPLEYNFQSNTVNSSYTYQWSFGDNSSSQNTASTANASHSFSSPGIYTVSLIVSAAGGCFSGVDTATFRLDLSNATPLQSFIAETSCNTFNAPWGTQYTQSGIYIDTLVSTDGCDSIRRLNLTINQIPLATASSTPASCGLNNGTASISASGGSGTYTYLWSNAATGLFNTGLAEGSYTVTATDQNGCSALAQVNVAAIPPVNVLVTASDTLIQYGDSVNLSVKNGVDYTWTPSTGLSCSNCSTLIANPLKNTTYFVTGKDTNGCAYSRSVTIVVEIICNELFVPDIFSPNGTGNPENEKLCVYSNCIKEMTFAIYNRWGELIFLTNDINACWDGTHKDSEASTGTYVYRLYVEQLDGQKIERTGNISLTR